MAYKQLKRSKVNRLFGGVCGGLGVYFDIDPIIFRLIFLLLTFAAGGGLIIYILLWILVPQDNIDFRHTSNNNHKTQSSNNNPSEKPEDAEYTYEDVTETSDVYVEEDKTDNIRRNSYVGGLILIIIGLLFLFDHLIYRFNISDWWPLILIAGGLFIMVYSPKKH